MKKILCLLLVFASSSLLFAQENYKQYMDLSYEEIDSLMYIHYRNSAYDKAIPLMQAGREKAIVDFGKQDSVLALYTTNLAFFNDRIGAYDKALSLYIQATKVYKEALGNKHPDYATSLNNLSQLYQRMGNYSQALSLCIQAKDIRKKVYGEKNNIYATSLSNLGLIYYKLGNYSLALPLYTQAKDIYEETLGKYHSSLAILLNNLASLHMNVGNYSQALSLYEQARVVFEKTTGKNHPNYAQSLNSLAVLHQRMENDSLALPLYIQSNEIYKKVFGTNHPRFAIGIRNLAALHQKMGNDSLALPLFIKAKEIREATLGKEHPLFASSLNDLAALYESLGDYEQAWDLLGRAMNSSSGIELTHDFDAAWVDRLQQASYASNEHLEKMLASLEHAYQWLQRDLRIQNATAKQIVVANLATTLLAKFQRQVSSEKDKLRMLSQSNDWLISSLAVFDPAEHTHKAFELSDQNKSVLLYQATKSEDAYRLGELPDSLVWQNKKMLKKQSQLQAELLERRSKAEKDSLRSELIEVNQNVDNFIETLKNKYPKYYELKYQQIETKTEAIQGLLDEETALMEYVITDSILHVFCIDKKEVVWKQKTVPASVLKANIKAIHSSLSDYRQLSKEQKKNFKSYTKLAHWFYQKIVAPVLSGKENIKNLIIVTDGELGHLPFEAFLVEAAKESASYKDLHYMLLDYNIVYNYSATLWQENKTAKEQANNGQMLAMAAHYSENLDSSLVRGRLPTAIWMRDALSPLPAAREEVEALANQFKGYFAFDSLATERILREKASDYAIIHLAMHGLLDENRPILSSLALTEDGDSLNDNFWKAHEISKMELNADLVVLSACETGYGRFETGNGIASLARAFMYAGVPSLVVSLWQVNDASTSVIMQNFYANLANGLDKAEALRQAKLRYIENVENDLAAHPAFWSPFILIGDESPVKLQKKSSAGWMSWAIGGGVGVLALLGLGLSRRKRAA